MMPIQRMIREMSLKDRFNEEAYIIIRDEGVYIHERKIRGFRYGRDKLAR